MCGRSRLLNPPLTHLDQGAGAVLLERLFEVLDGRDLGGPEAGFFECGHVLEAGEEGLAKGAVVGRAFGGFEKIPPHPRPLPQWERALSTESCG